jgi:NADPH:quinone reductase-like Zn-dependent oxidoreductase
MSAFDDFVQLELPKRPYLNTDPATETVMVRRGSGPRQLQPVALSEGQVLAFVNGELVGTLVSSLGNGVRKAVLPVAIAASTWTITHNLNSQNAIIQVVDASGYVVLPNEIQITSANVITVTFGTAMTGTVRAIFLD